jgi:ABC-type bacteriocin/lantibiotic exporter with double-glycine peptidase domain
MGAGSSVQKPPAQVSLENGVWRVPQRDGLNCLYVFLRLHGSEVSYEQLEAMLTSRKPKGGTVTLLDLKETARSCGLAVEIQSCPPGAELHARLPAITTLESVRERGEAFALLFERPDQERNMYLMYGGSAWLGRLPIDEFLRSWSGLILTTSPLRRDALTRFAPAFWIVGGLLFTMEYVFWRLTRASD